jgi:23S rRNA pseudouridine1911/1915/1917 synthase
MDAPVGRHPTMKTRMAVLPENKGGRAALTEWRVLYAPDNRRFSLLAVDIYTGRTHQIRVHLAHAGNPLWGDRLYAPRGLQASARRQMLHAWKLSFPHPASGEFMDFTCPPPADFVETAVALAGKMQRVILTGVPGCGKSTALRLLRAEGIPVWSADEAVAGLYLPGADGWLALRNEYGPRFFSGPRQELDRAALTAAFREKPGLRQKVEALIHPLAAVSMERFFTGEEQAGRLLAVAEVPLWHEGGARFPGEPPVVVTVACPGEIRHRRLERNRGWSAEKIAAMEAWQWPEEAKIRASHFALDNSGDEDALAARVKSLLRHLDGRRRTESSVLRQRWDAIWGETGRESAEKG